MDTTTVDGSAGLSQLLRAALPSLPVVGGLPGIRKASTTGFEGLAYRRPPVTVRREDVDTYARVCGFPVKDTVPVTYPHLLAFGLHLAIMTDAAFPAPAVGMVHVENAVTRHRQIAVGDRLEVCARVGPPGPHPQGTVYAFATNVSDHQGMVWESTSTYLRRGPGDHAVPARTTFAEAPPTGTVWSLPADLGRTYAAVSGDHNPIHLYPLTARALGFPRQVAHGMWTKARCVAALENRLPDAVRVEVAFRKPVLLPGHVALGSAVLEDGYVFSLTDPGSGAPHLTGRTTSL